MCLGTTGTTVTLTCNDGCLREPLCKSTQCNAQVAPTGFELDGACEGKIDDTKTCKVKKTDPNYFLGTLVGSTFTAVSETITCNKGSWSHAWVSQKKDNCNAIPETPAYSAGQTVAFGGIQTVTPKDDYTCSRATSTCGYNGIATTPLCQKKTCPAANLAAVNVKETPNCAGDKQTEVGKSCAVTAADDFTWVKEVTTTTRNQLTLEEKVTKVYTDEGATYSFPCVGAAGPNFRPGVDKDDFKGNKEEFGAKTISTKCTAPTDTTMWKKKDCADGKKGDGKTCTFEATDDYTCTGLSTTCAFNGKDAFVFKTPDCKLKVGCDIPKLDGLTANAGCNAGDRVAKDVTCTFTNANTDLWECTNTGANKCVIPSFEKLPSCTKKSVTAKGSTMVEAVFQLANNPGDPMFAPAEYTKLFNKGKAKIESVAGTPDDYTVVKPTRVNAKADKIASSDSVWTDGTNFGIHMKVTGLTTAQATALVNSFKTDGAAYVKGIDDSFCIYSFGKLDMETRNGQAFPLIYIDGKLDLPVILTGVAGAGSIISVNAWFMGVLAFLFLGMTR
jgi:hypothetical protein